MMTVCRRKHNKVCFSELYVYCYLMVLLVVSTNEAITNYGVVIPFVQFNTAFLLLGLGLMGVLHTLFRGRLKIDLITILLFGRIVMSFLPFVRELGDVHSSYLGNFVMTCVPLMVYVFFRNAKIEFNRIIVAFLLFGLLVALQCIWAYLSILQKGLATYNAPYYKNYFVIPVGATNNISAILLPLLILGDQTIKKNGLRNCYVALLLVGIYLCKSRTGLILVLGYLLIKLFIKERGKYEVWKKLALVVLPCVGVVVCVLLYDSEIGIYIRTLMLGYSSAGGSINSLFSGRFSLFGKALNLIGEHLLLGNGLTYEKIDFMRPHNVLLQMAFENGIVGLGGFLIFLIHSIRQVWMLKDKDRWIYAFSVMIPFIFVNAMFEDSMLTSFMILIGLAFLAYAEKITACGGKKNV